MKIIHKPIIIIGFAIILIINGCISKHNSATVKILDNGVVDINVLKVAQNPRDFPLSKIVKDVDFIQLESTVESCYCSAVMNK